MRGILAQLGLARSGGTLMVVNAAWLSVLAALGLSLIGVYAIQLGDSDAAVAPLGLTPTATKQLFFLCIGVGAAIAVTVPNFRMMGAFSWILLGLSVALLVFLLIPFVPKSIVTPRNGARGWINLGPVDFQPAEVAKIAYVLALAHYLRFRSNYRRFWGLVPPAIITMVPVGLIMRQPDLGTASLFIPALFSMLVGAGAKLRHLTIIVLLATLAAPASYPVLAPHQKARIVGLIQQFKGDESADLDINMQSRTAQRLIGAGEGAGVPAAHSRALVRFNALPERHNDMIFAVIVNRFGFLGGVGFLALYLVWIAGALIAAGMSKDPFGRLLCVGLTAFIAAQVFINVGMNLGVLPIIGITLPFVSYGGSSMLTVWLMTGLIFNVAMRRPRGLHRPSFQYGEEETE